MAGFNPVGRVTEREGIQKAGGSQKQAAGGWETALLRGAPDASRNLHLVKMII